MYSSLPFSPTVLELVQILYKYKPSENFVIVGDDNLPDYDALSDDSLDSMNLSGDEKDEKGLHDAPPPP